MSPIIATTFCPGASPLPAGAASTVPATSMPGTRGKVTPTLTPRRSFSSERLRPNASTRMRTQPSRSGGSGRVVSRRLSTGPGPESRTARIVVGEDVTGCLLPRSGDPVGHAQRAAAAASFPPANALGHRPRVPLLGQERVGKAVEPSLRSVEGLLDRVKFAAHSGALHQAPGRLIVEEAVRVQPPQAERPEAKVDQGPHRLGRVPVAAEGRIERPAELPLDALRLIGDLLLGPAVLDLQHQVADHSAIELNDEQAGKPLSAKVALAVLVVRSCRRPQPVMHLRQPPEGPGRVEIVGGGPPQQQPPGANRPLERVQRMTHELPSLSWSATRTRSVRRRAAPPPQGRGITRMI